MGERVLHRSHSGRPAVWAWVFCLGILGESRAYGVMLDPAAGHDGAAEFLLSLFLFGEVVTVFTSSSLSPLHLGD